MEKKDVKAVRESILYPGWRNPDARPGQRPILSRYMENLRSHLYEAPVSPASTTDIFDVRGLSEAPIDVDDAP